MSNQKFETNNAPKPVGLYPHARKVGDLLFLSGVGARDAKTNEIHGNVYDKNGKLVSYDIEAQCHTVFQNVKAILEASGSSWDKLVDVTVFLINMEDDFKAYNKVYAEYFKDNQPCRTTLGISALPTPIAIELKCVAMI